MKNILKIFAVLYFILQPNIYSQQLVQTINDLYKLKDNEHLFINKPLKDLLKEIKPEIRIAFPNNENPSFDFRFITPEKLRKNEGTTTENVSLFVGVNNFIEWSWEKRPKGKEPNWTKADAEKYGNLIVTRISIVYPRD